MVVVQELESFLIPSSAGKDDAAHTTTTHTDESSSSLSHSGQEQLIIRTFSLSLQGVTVEVCSLGASLLRFLVPCAATTTNTGNDSNGHDDSVENRDDIVLGYPSPLDMWKEQNPNYLGVVVGRVANRIAKGQLQLAADGPVHELEINNGPNHLHGGKRGFSHCVWDSEIVQVEEQANDGGSATNVSSTPAVRFSLLSPDGDQGYPGTIRVSATYSLRRSINDNTVRLCVDMQVTLLDDKPTPINMAQHSYFNLSRHDDPAGILDHRLHMPNCLSFTPLDDTSIPTRQVRPVAEDPAMSWCRQSRLLGVALVEYGVTHCGLSPEQAMANTKQSRLGPDNTPTGPDGKPLSYGFDHNYVVTASHKEGLTTVAVLEHTSSKRRLTIRSNAPGVQLYTGNFLDGTSTRGKNDTPYKQWQGLCLETQHYPNSFLVDSSMHAEFAKGACRILTPAERCYLHLVEYILEYNVPVPDCDDNEDSRTKASAMEQFCGSDSNGRMYGSVREMWQEQGVIPGGSSLSGNRGSWYQRAAKHYEENCEATIDGVLGGFADISEIDLAASRNFVQDLQRIRPSLELASGVACECGAGIGRISKGLLLSCLGVARSDLVESSSRLLSAAPEYLGDELAGKCRFYCAGLQDWEPKPNSYCIIWIQWVLCYLTDEDAVAFLNRCGNALLGGGVIVLKENTCPDEDFVLDADDASVTRSIKYWKHLCEEAALQVVHEEMQNNFPDDIFPVLMIALEKQQES